MSDLISRAEAKEALRERLKRIPTYAIWAMHTIDELPTHPTPSNTLGALDCVERQAAIDLVESFYKIDKSVLNIMVFKLKQLPSTQTERWDTCFDCPLSHGCPVINGCTNEQAMQYAGDIPNNCPLNKTERKIGEWIYYDPNGFKCSRCGRYLEIECGDVKMNFCPHCGSYNGGEHNE